jgi:ABC-type branched-subunit amino acid transport system substrate-binding protein
MFAEINKHGGIHGRQIELVVAEYTDDAVRNVWRVREVLERESIFALVGSYSIGIEAELAEIAEEFEVPAVGPFTQLPRTGDNGERHTFYLTGGLVEQAAVLARSLVGRTDEALTSVAVVHPAGRIYEHAVETVQGVLARYGAPAAVEVPYTPPDFDVTAIADALLSTGSQAVLVLTSAKELNLLGTELQKRSAAPDLLLPGLFASADMFALGDAYGGRLLVGYPSIPADHTPAGVREFETLHADYAFGYEHSAAQISAFVAAKVLAEGLKRAGRGLSREKLMDALEGLSEFRPGLMPALSYGRRNRIGANGGYVLEADLGQQKFVGAGDWISLRN